MVINNHFWRIIFVDGDWDWICAFPIKKTQIQTLQMQSLINDSFIHSSQKEAEAVHVWREQQSLHLRNNVEMLH